MPYLDEKSTN